MLHAWVWPGYQVAAAHNSIQRLPLGLACASALLALDLSCNQLQALDGSALAAMAALTCLKLSRNALQGCLPPEVGRMAR
jgi:Leucine-rich repeat (LRR) protein